MSGTPRAAGLVLCERMQVDPDSGTISLLGLFNTLSFDRWPTPPYGFTAYAPLYGGSGEGTIELVVSRMETEQRVYRYQRWYAAPADRTVHLEIPVQRCVFPVPGRYALLLRFDRSVVTFRYLDLLARSE